MKRYTLYLTIVLAVIFIQAGCVKNIPSDPQLESINTRYLPQPDVSTNIRGLRSCTTSPDTSVLINSHEPVNVIVHGCNGSAARFRALAQVFAFHGQQTVCFYYNDRDSLIETSGELIHVLETLADNVKNKQITVIGHSLGGLISRKALVKDRENSFQSGGIPLRLVTISAPFAGIKAAGHCASVTARILTLGLAVPICKIISGDKWHEITSPSQFIQYPGELIDQVNQHIKIVTNEAGTCRYYNDKGICVEDDLVFSVEEQYFKKVDVSPRVTNIDIAAGHVEIVGDYLVPPAKLIGLLQSNGIMKKTRLDQQESLSKLLSQLY